jgi:formylglycine-generating enzyme required for sulfatase activity
MIRILVASLALACLLVGFQARAEVPTNTHGVAVIIGNKAYPGRTPDAEYAHNDAAAMKKFVVDRLGYRPGNIIDLRDATKGQMEAVFGTKETHKGKLFNWMRPGKSDVVVFYSGHGVPGLQDKRGYLLPVDGDPNLAEITGFPVDRLYANLAKLPARSVTVFLDACFSGETPKGMLVRAASGLTVTPRAPETARSLTVITAAQGDQFASWDEDAKHGLFTRHLLLALGGKADGSAYGNGDGKVSLDEAKKYLDEEMTYQARRRYGREQTASVQGAGGVVLASISSDPAAAISSPSVQVDEMDASYLMAKRANVRSGPSTTFSKISQFSPGAAVDVTGKVLGKDWYRVALAGGGEGYVWGRLLSEQQPTEKPKAAPPKANKKVAIGVYPKRYRPGDTFKDCPDCPEMVVIPPGQFRMGDLSDRGEDNEKPVHDVTINYSFAVGKFEVTQAQWRAVMGSNPSGFKGDARPVERVSWDDAKDFVRQLSAKTGQRYRLLSEAEWEYVARAGTTTKYHWGNLFYGSKTADGSETAPVGRYDPNAFGLYDVHGNVWEWTEDCYHDSYYGAPTDGSSWTSGGYCGHRVLRGGSWDDGPRYLRAAIRYKSGTGLRGIFNGFRVARTLSSGRPGKRSKQLKPSPPTQVVAVIPPKVMAPKPAKPAVGVYPERYRPGDTFKDCDDCPQMVMIPRGQFRMGDLSGHRDDDERPVHDVRINYSFAVGKFEVTQAQWRAVMGDNPSRQEGDTLPVLNVSWHDAKEFVSRLSRKTDKSYRLLSEAEWEYVARAGARTKYSWGNEIDATKAAYGSASLARTVGSFAPNAFGLYDMHGNVWEWTEDCWNDDYSGAPTDGSVWKSGDCDRRVLRGGSWNEAPGLVRAAIRYGNSSGSRYGFGFRIARSSSP